MSARKLVRGSFLTAASLLVAVFAAFPFYWMITTAFKPDDEIFTTAPQWFPHDITFEQFREALTGGYIRGAFVNSLVVTLATTVLSIFVAALAALAVSRFRFRGRIHLLILVLIVQMVPLESLVIPLFIIMRDTGMLNTLTGLVITYVGFTLPFGIWMLKGFYDGIPADLEQAAMTDGASRIGAFWRILFPLVAPGLVATAIFSFIMAWNEFLLALTFLQDQDKFTVPIALSAFIGRGSTQWGPLMAASLVFTIPVLVFFLFVQRHLAKGLVQGAVKG